MGSYQNDGTSSVNNIPKGYLVVTLASPLTSNSQVESQTIMTLRCLEKKPVGFDKGHTDFRTLALSSLLLKSSLYTTNLNHTPVYTSIYLCVEPLWRTFSIRESHSPIATGSSFVFTMKLRLL